MKKLKLFSLLMLLFVGVTSMWATDEVYKSLTFPDANSAINGLTSNQYTSTWTAKNSSDESWSISNFNNNNWNNSWTYIKAGPKNTTSSVGTIVTSFAMSEAITKVIVTGSILSGTNYSVTSTKLIIASNSSFTEDKVEISGSTTFTNDTIMFVVSSPTANRYYKLAFDCKNTSSGSSGKNGHLTVNRIDYYKTVAANPTV